MFKTYKHAIVRHEPSDVHHYKSDKGSAKKRYKRKHVKEKTYRHKRQKRKVHTSY